MAVILVAEDEPAIRELVRGVLESAGHEVMTAITDITMPVMDGIQAALRIRETRTHARIVCLSGYSEARPPSDVLFLEQAVPAGGPARESGRGA